MDATAIDRITSRVARALASGDAVPPRGLRLLLRRFASTGQDDLRDLLGPALADAAAAEALDSHQLPEHLLLLAEAIQISDDAWLTASLARVAALARSTWPHRGAVADAASTIDGCLAAAAALASKTMIAEAIDELERVVGVAYEPGDGVAQTLSTRTRTTGDLDTHVAVALALLRAYDVCGRPAYPMLSEELLQPFLRAEISSGTGATCEAARVLVRLADLQRDPDYRTIAVTRADAAYREVAERWLRAFDPEADVPLGEAVTYALALDECLRLT